MSKKNRQAFIKTVVAHLNEIDPGNPSIPILEEKLKTMSAKRFEAYIEALRNGVSAKPDINKPREIIPIVVPNFKPTKISTNRNLKLAQKWGLNFQQRVWMVEPNTGTKYLTNRPYMLLDSIVVRQAQVIDKKMSYVKDSIIRDQRTGQISSRNKGSSLSSPEVQSLLSQGRKETTLELFKFRGGDERAYAAMSRSLMETGEFSMSSYIEPSRAKSTDVVSMFYNAMHLDNNI